MRICIVGGIFGRSDEYRRRHRFAPEVVLAEGLASRGISVEPVSHQAFRPDGRWDVVHAHHLAQGTIRAASAGGTVPLVFTSHDGPILCGYEKSLTRRSAFGYVVRRADALVALSRREARVLELRYGMASKTEVIPNGIHAEVFQLSTPQRPRERPVALYVGQLIELKGVDVLLRAVARLPPHKRPQLRLAYQNASLEPKLRALAEALGITERVDFVGFLGPEALAREYSACDVVVLPSHAEALPSVVTEAMLCGVSVVASAVGGIPEQVGPLGHLAPPGSVSGLANALRAALARLPLSQEARLALRARAEAGSRISAMIDGHLRLYDKVLRQWRPRSGRGVVDHMASSVIELYGLARGGLARRAAP